MKPFQSNILKSFAVLATALLLGACQAPVRPAPDPDKGPVMTPPSQQAPSENPSGGDAEPSAAAASATIFDERLIFELLVAEIAGQRGVLDISARAYLDVAQKTRNPDITRRAVHVAVYSRDHQTALAAARLWVSIAPSDIEARQSLAALLINNGELDEAVTHLEFVVQSFGESPEKGFSLLGNLLSRERNSDRAMIVMERIMEKHPQNPDALYHFAHLADTLGEDTRALAIVNELLELEPGRTKGWLLKANVLTQLGEDDAALQTVAHALELEPENSRLRLSYARMLIKARRLEDSREQFLMLERENPDDPDIAYALGLLAMEAKELDTAEEYFRKLLSMDGRRDEAAYSLAQIAESRGDIAEALQWYRSVEGSHYMDARLRIADITARTDGTDQAIAYLNTLELQDDEDLLRRYLGIGSLLRDAERYEEAIENYSDALVMFLDNTDLLYIRAMTWEKLGRIDMLEQDLKQILEKEPENAQALNALGYTLADRTNRLDEALDYVQKAYALNPNDAAIIDSLGWVYYRMNQPEKALELLEKANHMLKDGEIAAHYGEVLWVLGQEEKARKVWNEALEYAPDHPVLLETISRFTKP